MRYTYFDIFVLAYATFFKITGDTIVFIDVVQPKFSALINPLTCIVDFDLLIIIL